MNVEGRKLVEMRVFVKGGSGAVYFKVLLFVCFFTLFFSYVSGTFLDSSSFESLGTRSAKYNFNIVYSAITAILFFVAIYVTIEKNNALFSIPLFFIFSLLVLHSIGSLTRSSAEFLSPLLHLLIAVSAYILATILVPQIKSAENKRIIPLTGNENRKLYAVLFVFLMVLVSYYVVYPTSVLKVLSSPGRMTLGDAVIENRISLYNEDEYHGSGYIELIRVGIIPLILGIMFMNVIIKREKRVLKPLLIMVVGIVLSVLSGQRWPVAFFLLFLFSIYISVFRVRMTTMLFSFIGFISLFSVLSFLNNRVFEAESFFGGLLNAIMALVYRLFIATNTPSFHVYDIFPYKIEYQYGATWVNDILAYLPGPDRLLGTEFASAIGMRWGSAPLTFFGEAYANGGFIGVFIFFFVLTQFLWLLERKLSAGTYYTLFGKIIHISMCIGAVRMLYGSGIGIISYHVLPLLMVSPIFLWSKTKR